jgi:hypothetical protein
MKSWHDNNDQQTLQSLPLPWGEGWGKGICAKRDFITPHPALRADLSNR